MCTVWFCKIMMMMETIMMSLILIMTKMLLLDIFSFSAGSDSGEQQLMVNSFLWNPFLSGIFTWKITPEQSHQHCQKEQDHLSYYNILFRCWELHNDDSVWVSRVENHMSCRRCLWPLPGGTSPTASCLSIPHSVLKGGGQKNVFFWDNQRFVLVNWVKLLDVQPWGPHLSDGEQNYGQKTAIFGHI